MENIWKIHEENTEINYRILNMEKMWKMHGKNKESNFNIINMEKFPFSTSP